MTIWSRTFTLDELNLNWSMPLLKVVGMVIIEIRDDGLSARVPVKPETQQPFGAWHGGMTCYIAESLASLGSHLCLADPGERAVGMALTASHLRPSFEGSVRFDVSLRHRGRKTHLWAFDAFDDAGKLMSTGTVTTAVTKV